MHQPKLVETEGRTIGDYRSQRRRIETTDWPDTGKQIGILYLSCKEQQDAYFAARDHFDDRNHLVDDPATEQFQLEWTYQLLMTMLVDPDLKNPTKKLFTNTKQLRAEMTPNDVNWFMDQHEKLQKEEYAKWTRRNLNENLQAIAIIVGLDAESLPEEVEQAVAKVVAERDQLKTDG